MSNTNASNNKIRLQFIQYLAVSDLFKEQRKRLEVIRQILWHDHSASGMSYPSQRRLARMSNVSVRTVRRALEAAEDWDWISTVRTGRGKGNKYMMDYNLMEIHLDLAKKYIKDSLK